MNGQAIYNLIVSILGDEAPDEVYMLQLANIERMKIESKRPWKVLSVVDKSQTVTGSNTYTNPFPLPANFFRYLGDSSLAEGSIVLFDGDDNIQVLTEVPIEQILSYKDEFGRFAVDYANNQFFITGIVPGTFTIYQYFIMANSDITLTTTWTKFPTVPNFTPILAFAACARWRLGTDWDEIAANNADDNVLMFKELYDVMCGWDTELSWGAVNSIDYRNDNMGYYNNTNYPGPRGVWANY